MMEDHRDDLVVIAAGHSEKMSGFISSNPGLESRFQRYIQFNDYTPNELLLIFKKMVFDSEMLLSEGGEKLPKRYFRIYTMSEMSLLATLGW